MALIPNQLTALAAFNKFLNRPKEPVFLLRGYAGTGKTTRLLSTIPYPQLHPIAMQTSLRPTLAQVRSLARQLSPASQQKLAAELLARQTAADVREIQAISRVVAADTNARRLSAITDEAIEQELRDYRHERRVA